LSGCASTLTINRDIDGKIVSIKGKGSQDSVIKQGDIEVRMNTKAEPLKDIININGVKGVE